MMRTLAVILTAVLGSTASALARKDCTFYAPFDGSLDAAHARGSREATVTGTIRFVPGIRGQGILVGAADTWLRYETRSNLDLEAGTVSVWVKPATWDESDGAMRHFFSLHEDDATGLLPRHG